MASTVWRGYITFGLISIPVRLFRAARAERVSLRKLYRSDTSGVDREQSDNEEYEPEAPQTAAKSALQKSPTPPSSSKSVAPISETVLTPVQQVSVRKGTDVVLAPQSVVRGYEYEKDKFVAVAEEELKSLAPKTSPDMEIQEFVLLAGIDPVYFETSYYVTPEEAGQKAYALLYRAMQTSGLVAVARFAMHSREHVVVLRPGKRGILAHTMFYASEVRADEEYGADTKLVSEKELGLAESLITSLTAPFEPEKYRDHYREQLQSLIARKVKGEPVTPRQSPVAPAEVVDIADALRRSLANLKKPAARSESQTKSISGAKTSRSRRGAG